MFTPYRTPFSLRWSVDHWSWWAEDEVGSLREGKANTLIVSIRSLFGCCEEHDELLMVFRFLNNLYGLSVVLRRMSKCIKGLLGCWPTFFGFGVFLHGEYRTWIFSERCIPELVWCKDFTGGRWLCSIFSCPRTLAEGSRLT